MAAIPKGSHPNPHGYALVELLIATLIASVLMGVLLRLAATVQLSIRTQSDVVDVQQRLRVATDMIHRDLMMAGAGPSQGPWRGGLVNAFAPIVPARTGERGADPELSQYDDRISIVYVPDTPAQTAIVTAMGGAGAPLAIDASAPGCPAGDCGFASGDRALVFDPADPDRAYDLFTVSDATAGLLSHAASLSKPYGVGSPVVKVVQHVYHFDRPGHRLMLYDGDASDLPLVDHVVDLRFTYYADPAAGSVPPPAGSVPGCAYAPGSPRVSLLQDLGGVALKALTPVQLSDGPACGVSPYRFDADLLRVRRVGVTLRLEAAGAEFRGAGPGFVSRGTSADGYRYIPDQQVTFEVAPRNMNGIR